MLMLMLMHAVAVVVLNSADRTDTSSPLHIAVMAVNTCDCSAEVPCVTSVNGDDDDGGS